ncbi:MAG: COG1361 S-layer family protein [Halodesulfurarchaeum sp.]
MSRLTGLLVVAVLTGLAVGPGMAVAAEDPRFETTIGQNYVVPGQTESLSVTLLNDAEDADDRVEPATNVVVELEPGDTPFTVTSGPRYLGTVRDGQPRQIRFAIDVPQNVESGVYTLPVEITYEYDGDERETTTASVRVRIADRAKFALVETTGDVMVNSDGKMTVTVENVGSEGATEATLRMKSRNGAIAFEGAQSGVRSVGALAPGERRTVTYTITATDRANPGRYPVTGTVRYDNEDGARRASRPLSGTVSVIREQSFSLRVGDADLRVDREGTISVSVRNTGPRSVTSANLVLQSTGRSIHPEQTEFALGTLEPGESTNATFEMTVDDDAMATPRHLRFQVTYREKDGDRKAGDRHALRVNIDPQRPVYEVEPVDASLPAGTVESVSVKITNLESSTLTSINAEAYTDTPITIIDDSAFVNELEPGESTTLEFQVEAPGDALRKDYPISLDFQYDQPDGETKLTDTYDVPVSITEATTLRDRVAESLEAIDVPTDSLLGVVAGFGISTFGFGTIALYRRRRR